MKLTDEETRFLTVLAREQNQTGCRGPAHDLLRQHAYPNTPLHGQGSLAFSYDAVPLTGILLRDMKDLQEINDFLRGEYKVKEVLWPWSSGEAYHARLEEARREWKSGNGAPVPAISRGAMAVERTKS